MLYYGEKIDEPTADHFPRWSVPPIPLQSVPSKENNKRNSFGAGITPLPMHNLAGPLAIKQFFLGRSNTDHFTQLGLYQAKIQ